MRGLFCGVCGASVSSSVETSITFRGFSICPECMEKISESTFDLFIAEAKGETLCQEPTITIRDDNPIRALCYIEGYIGRIMAEHGLAIEPELQKRFDMVYAALDRSDVININVPQFDIETFAQEWNQK